MCGITGFIGKTKRPDITSQLLSVLFDELDSRGTDAAGCWATEAGDGRVFFHKEPERSSRFVKKHWWNEKVIKNHQNMDLMLLHARAASVGVGVPSTNRNNHPFVSEDGKIAIVHNGKIQDSEHDVLKNKYKLKSFCDSELFLRIFQSGDVLVPSEAEGKKEEKIMTAFESRLQGLKSIWSQITKGHMAVAIGERLDNGNRRLWLFHNKERPLWIIDVREQLGMLFFCSTPEIWLQAVERCPKSHSLLKKKTKLIEFPTEEIWCLPLDAGTSVFETEKVMKYTVSSDGTVDYEHQGPEIGIVQAQGDIPEIVTQLDENENVVKVKEDEEEQKKAIAKVTRLIDENPHIATTTPSSHGSVKVLFDHNNVEISGNVVATLESEVTKLDKALEGIKKAFSAKLSSSVEITEKMRNDYLEAINSARLDIESAIFLLKGD